MDLGQALAWLGQNLWSGVGGGFIGAFLGGFAKFFWERWLPDTLTWRRQQSQEHRRVLALFRDPMLRSAYDLQSRLLNIIRQGGLAYLDRQGERQYGVDSSLFVVAQYFAWAEILQQRIRMLNFRALSTALEAMSDKVGDGSSALRVFRMQQREIGERMVKDIGADGEPRVLSYTEFLEFLDTVHQDPPSPLAKSLAPVVRAIDGLLSGTGEKQRLLPIQHALVDLIKCVDDPQQPWLDASRLQKL